MQISDAALAECQGRHDDFTRVKQCLPFTHVALRMLDAVRDDQFFGEAGRSLVQKCASEYEASVVQWWCAEDAIEDAVELLDMVGDPARIEDPLFAGLAKPDALQRLEVLHDEERSPFPYGLQGPNQYLPD